MIRRKPRLVLASTCADRKAVIAADRIPLREVPHGTPRQRAISWASRLKKSKGGCESADRLYLGDHWQATARAHRLAEEMGFAAELWVISAGYGFYPVETPVGSYAATFSPGHEDSVLGQARDYEDRLQYFADWWETLAVRLPLPGVSTRTVTAMARKDPEVRLLIVTGRCYLEAITLDLFCAAQHLRSPDQMAIISCGGARQLGHVLADHLLPVDARFQQAVGGARSALNARIAGQLLSRLPDASHFGLDRLRRYAEEEADGLGDPVTYDRKKMVDEDVRQWIRDQLRSVERPSASALLRMFRDSGLACEQKRFGRLYKEVAAPRGRTR